MNKQQIYPILFIALVSLSIVITLNSSFISVWDRILTPFEPSLNINKDVYTWDYSTVGGRYYIYLAHLPYHLFIFIFSLILTPPLANTLFFYLLFFSSGLGMYYFISYLVPHSNIYIPFLAAFSYMFNPFWNFRLYSAPMLIIIMALLPWLLLIYIKALNFRNNSTIYIFKLLLLFSVLSFILISGFSEIAAGLITIIFLLTFGFLYSIFFSNLKRFILVSFFLFLLLFPLHLFWIFPNFQHQTIKEAVNREGQYIIDTIGSLRLASEEGKYYNLFRVFAYYKYAPASSLTGNTLSIRPAFETFYESKHIQFLLFFGSLTILLGFLFSNGYLRKLYQLFLIIFLSFIPLFYAAFNPPFGKVIYFLVISFPYYVFRRPSVYMFILQFIFSVLFALSFQVLLEKFANLNLKNNKNPFLIKYSLLSFFVILLILFGLPQILFKTTKVDLYDDNNKITQVSVKTKLPDYVYNLKKTLNSFDDNSGILILPKVGSVRAYNWPEGYFGWDVYMLLQEKPVLSHYRYGFNYPNDQLYDLIEENIVFNNYPKFNKILSLLDIEYIIFVNDSLQWGKDYFNKSRDKSFLDNNPEIRLIEQSGQHYLYKLNMSTDIFYIIYQSFFYPERKDKINIYDYFEDDAPGSDRNIYFTTDNLTQLVYNFSESRLIKKHYSTAFISNYYINKDKYNLIHFVSANSLDSQLQLFCISSGQSGRYIYLEKLPNDPTYFLIDNCENNSRLGFVLKNNNTDYPRLLSSKILLLEMAFDLNHLSISKAINTIISLNGSYNSFALINNLNYSVSNFNQSIKLSIEKINPTRYKLYFLDVPSNDFILGSSLFYDDSWEIFHNGAVSVKKIFVNGGFNGWKINSSKDALELEVVFTKQILIFKLLYLSISFLIIESILLLFLFMKEDLKWF